MTPTTLVINQLREALRGLPLPYDDPEEFLLDLGSELSFLLPERDEQIGELLAHPEFPIIRAGWLDRYNIDLREEIGEW